MYADLLVTVDGRKAFHAKRVGLQLVPDWPMEHWKHLAPAQTQLTGEPVPLRSLSGLVNYVEPKPCATVDGFAFDYHSLLACAWGPPSAAFGPFYKRFDGTRRAARLPGPPYHFMSRITKLDGPLGGMKPGTTVEVEYDVPVEQWYFEQNGNPTMPFCVVMEAALQPCGWLASYVGSALTTETDMLFRNLDGTGTMFTEILPASGIFKTKVKLLSISQSAGMIIENFDVECFIGEQKVFAMKTVFGFFPKEAFENQVGLPVTPDERTRMTAPAKQTIDLTARPREVLRRRAAAARRHAADARPGDRVHARTAGRRTSATCARRRPSTSTSGSSRRTSSRTRCSRARWASRRCASCCSSSCSRRAWARASRTRASSR